MHSEILIRPMREELKSIGFQELLDPEAVETLIGNEGTALVMINFLTRTAAIARAGMALAVSHKTLPDRFGSVFDEQEAAATDRVRQHLREYPRNRPSFALFKNGELVECLPEYQLAYLTPEAIATELIKAFDAHCAG